MIDTTEVASLAVRLGESAAAVTPGAHEIIVEGAELIVDTARTYVPRRSDATYDSIDFDEVDELTAEIGPTTPYAPFIEYGTVNMDPRPFMAPALDRHEGAIVAAFDVLSDDVLGATSSRTTYIPVGDVLAGSLYQGLG